MAICKYILYNKFMKLQKAPEQIEASEEQRTIWPLAISAASISGWFMGRSVATPYATAHGWRGNEGLWDVWSHANNVFDTMLVVGGVFLLIRNGSLFYKTSLAKACAIGSAIATAGIVANAMVDTPGFTDNPTVAPIIENRFPGDHAEPNIEDQIWGDAASILGASLLTAAIATRRKEEDENTPQIVTIKAPA